LLTSHKKTVGQMDFESRTYHLLNSYHYFQLTIIFPDTRKLEGRQIMKRIAVLILQEYKNTRASSQKLHLKRAFWIGSVSVVHLHLTFTQP